MNRHGFSHTADNGNFSYHFNVHKSQHLPDFQGIPIQKGPQLVKHQVFLYVFVTSQDSTALVERASVLLAAIYENRAASNLDLTNGAPEGAGWLDPGAGRSSGGPMQWKKNPTMAG